MLKKFILVIIGTFFFLPLALSAAETPNIQYGVETQSVTLHQSFTYQIIVKYDKEVNPPKLPTMPDFIVQAQPPLRSSSSNISIINGQRSSSHTIQTVFNYTLTPKRLGSLQIPSVSIVIDNKRHGIPAIPIHVTKAEEISGIFLEMSTSVQKCYVGEPVMITWQWYFDRQIYGFSFDLPIFKQDNFFFPDYTPEINSQQQQQYLKIPNLQNQQLIGKQGRARARNQSLNCVLFRYPFIPTKAGTYSIDESSVTCEIADKQKQRRRSSPFDDFDSFFGNHQTATKKITVSSKSIILKVLPLPVTGKPSNFSCIIGTCKISTSATPKEVNVGEPIILTLKLSGPKFMENLQLPSLESQENLSKHFKISSEEPGIIENDTKVFQRTLRANAPDVTEIPPIEISYFNSQTGKYEIASSQAIPIKVAAAREVTTKDIQGIQRIPTEATISNNSNEIQATTLGIAHNYDTKELLYKRSSGFFQWLLQPLIAALLIFPVLLWILLFSAIRIYRYRHLNQHGHQIQQAGNSCIKQLKRVQCYKENTISDIYNILQNYFSVRLSMSAGTISAQDLKNAAVTKPRLTEKVLPTLVKILEQCEISRFAGTAHPVTELQLKEVITAIKQWEKWS